MMFLRIFRLGFSLNRSSAPALQVGDTAGQKCGKQLGDWQLTYIPWQPRSKHDEFALKHRNSLPLLDGHLHIFLILD